MSYSVDTSNIFAILQGGSKDVAAAKPADTTAPITSGNRERKSSGRGGRGGRGRGRGRGNASVSANGDLADSRDKRRPRRENRRGRGFEQRGRGGKRTYDRHSGTKQGSTTEKKGGAGAGNWGRAEDSLAGSADAKKEIIDDAESPEEEEAADEPATLSLEEYEKQKAEKAAKIDLPQPRQAGEGEDDSRWSNLAKLDREEINDSVSTSKGKKKNKKGVNYVPVDKVFKVQEPKNKRGNDRENRGGKGDRGGRGRKNNVNFSLNDDSSFPSLGGK